MSEQRGAAKSSDDPWISWLDRDDRALVETLSKKAWSAPEVLSRVNGLLSSIVTAVVMSDHSRWGVQPSKSSLDARVREFADYLYRSGEWDKLWKAWRKDSKGPWSLPFFLTRACWRFEDQREPKHRQRPHTHSGLRTLSELPPPLQRSIVGNITEPLLDAFVSMTHRLPDSCRLVYQLHLEGLINNEIASLLKLDLGEVEEKIFEAKHLLDFTGPGVGGQGYGT